MLRKLTLALVAAATLGTVAIAPTSASAWGWGVRVGFGPRVFVGARAFVGPGYYGRGWCYWHPYRC
jgi:hypothetical protein